MEDKLYVYHDRIYTEQPKHTVTADCYRRDGVTYEVVKNPSYAAHIIVLILICIVSFLIVQEDKVSQTVVYSTKLHCKGNSLELNAVNDISNSYDISIRIYNGEGTILDGVRLKPGQDVGDVSINAAGKSGTSGIYKLEYTIYSRYKKIIETYDVLIVFE